jgi:hypothetical protein
MSVCHFSYPKKPKPSPVKLTAIKERKTGYVCINGGINMKAMTK